MKIIVSILIAGFIHDVSGSTFVKPIKTLWSGSSTQITRAFINKPQVFASPIDELKNLRIRIAKQEDYEPGEVIKTLKRLEKELLKYSNAQYQLGYQSAARDVKHRWVKSTLQLWTEESTIIDLACLAKAAEVVELPVTEIVSIFFEPQEVQKK